jgi:hypothetical protein
MRSSEDATGRESDDGIRAVVTRLSRPHVSGGTVIERAAIVAEGADASGIVDWIMAHAGQAEAPVAGASARGLHGPRLSDRAQAQSRVPLRYVLPIGALAGDDRAAS